MLKTKQEKEWVHHEWCGHYSEETSQEKNSTESLCPRFLCDYCLAQPTSPTMPQLEILQAAKMMSDRGFKAGRGAGKTILNTAMASWMLAWKADK